jgi:hypothetical protein
MCMQARCLGAALVASVVLHAPALAKELNIEPQ